MKRLCMVSPVVLLLFLLLPSFTSAGTFLAFGPTTYVRDAGMPVAMASSFTVLDPTTTYTLRIDNAGVSSAVIMLNGATVVSPSDFNGNVTIVTKPVILLTENSLAIELASAPGTSFTVRILGSDNVPPSITAAAAPPANAAGWNNSNVTVSFTCSDHTSGIASCSSPVTVSSDGADQVITGTAVDNAQNTASTSVAINLDKTPPSLTITSPPEGATVFTPSVSLTGHVSDALAGPATVTCNGVTASIVGSTFTCVVPLMPGSNAVSVTAADIAGNTASSSLQLVLVIHPVDTWLASHPAAAQSLVFYESYVTGWQDWSNWSDELRQELRDVYDAIANGEEQPIPVPENQWTLTDLEPAHMTALADGDARSLYLSQVAHSLYVEIEQLVPWSLEDLDPATGALNDLFDARRQYFETVRACIPADHSLPSEFWVSSSSSPPGNCAQTAFAMRSGTVIPMDASRTWQWIMTQGWLGTTRLSTIGNMLEWEREHLQHRAGGFEAVVAEYYWGHRSLPPAEVMLLGHVPQGNHPTGAAPPTSHAHFSNGCGSVGDLVRTVLGTVNIPVGMPITVGGHGGIRFPSEGLWISHGDNIYNVLSSDDHFYDSLDLFLDVAQWQEWFPISSITYLDTPVVYEAQHLDVEVSLMVLERLPAHVPAWLLADYCHDLSTGQPWSSGQVYGRFDGDFTVDQLNDHYSLWSWLAYWSGVLGCP